MSPEQIDRAIFAKFPEYPWVDDEPMPSESWGDGGPLLEQECINFDHNAEPNGWGNGSAWRATWRNEDKYCPNFAQALGATMLIAGMLAILAKPELQTKEQSNADR